MNMNLATFYHVIMHRGSSEMKW